MLSNRICCCSHADVATAATEHLTAVTLVIDLFYRVWSIYWPKSENINAQIATQAS